VTTARTSKANRTAAFSPRTVLLLLLFGALAFVAALYFIGMGDDSNRGRAGGSHVLDRGLSGYAALAELLEARGYEVSHVRNPGKLEDETLLILTPPIHAEIEEINKIIEARRYRGPTLLVLPKWLAMEAPSQLNAKARPGWVVLLGANKPEWARDVGRDDMIDVRLENPDALPGGWSGLGLSGTLPDSKAMQNMTSDALAPLVRDGEGRGLASYWNDNGVYPGLASWANAEPNSSDNADADMWPVVIVAEPDLLNNYGLADRQRAMVALGIVEATLEDYDMPIVFDVTLNGLGNHQNLLTLAFSPPFLAATLCLLLAAVVVAWRAMQRFGPPLAGAPTFAFGKQQLARNVAALIQRSKRLHLLGTPYATIMRGRVTHLLGLKHTADAGQTEAAIDTLLARRGIASPEFSRNAEALRRAGSPHELLRRAHALKQIERKLSK